MATITVTNQVASQALFGQGVKVTLDTTDSGQLANLSSGMPCEVSSSSALGTINTVDTYGNSFTVAPIDGATAFASDTPVGYLADGEDITITTS